MLKIRVEDGAVRGLLNKLSGRLRNMSPVMRAISGIMRQAVEENFEQQGRPKWLDIAASTKKQRERKGYWPGKILQRRGELAASITAKYDNNTAIVGTNKVYAAIHQFGGDITHQARQRKMFFRKKEGRTRFTRESKAQFGMKAMGKAYTTHIPARPFLKLTDGDYDKIKRKIESYIVDGG